MHKFWSKQDVKYDFEATLNLLQQCIFATGTVDKQDHLRSVLKKSLSIRKYAAFLITEQRNNNNSSTFLTFIDASKCFDMVSP